MRAFRRAAVLAASACALSFGGSALAQSFPLTGGEYVNITSVNIDDGHNLDYAQFLAGQWKDQEEFAKAQGWITSYEILQNVDKRAGEPDLYLVVQMKGIPDAAEQNRRDKVVKDHVRMTDAQMEAGSGDRAKYRHILGSMTLQQLVFK